MPALFKRSNGIYYFVYDDGQRRRWRSTGERIKSLAFQVLLQFKEKETYRPSPRLFSEFAKEFLEHSSSTHSPKTLGMYRSTFVRFQNQIGDKLLREISSMDVDEYKANRLKAVSPASVNIELRSLKAAFYTAIRWKLLLENPLRGIRLVMTPETQPVYLKKADLEKLLQVVSETWLKDLITVAVFMGLRRGELINLTWEDIDFGRRLIHVQSNESYRTKWGKKRVLPMNEAVYRTLMRRYANSSTTKYVFMTRGRRILEGSLTKKFKACVKKAGMERGIHLHTLRHTFATWLVQAGISIYEVQKLMGHSSISVTQVYSHLMSSELHRSVEKISFLLSGGDPEPLLPLVPPTDRPSESKTSLVNRGT